MTRHPARTPGCARVKRRKQERLISCFGTATHSKMAHPQTWDPERYARNARFVAELGAPVVDLLAPRAGERILDLGCGDGVLTAKLASMGCHVIGVDASEPQIGAALDEQSLEGHRRSASCTQAARTFRSRIRRPRLRGQDQEGVSRSPQSPRHQRRSRKPLVFPHRRRLFTATDARRICRELYRPDTPPNSAPW